MTTPREPSDLAKNRLSAVCGAIDKAYRWRWGLVGAEGVLIGVLVVALMDYWFLLPVAVRSVAAGALLCVIGLGVAGLVRLWRRSTHLKQGALKIEAENPQLGCEISTTAEYLTGERKIQHDYEPELVEALKTRAATHLATVPPGLTNRFGRYGTFLAATVVILLILAWLLPGALIALQHAVIPFSKAKYTKVEVSPGNLEIPVGKDFEITNCFSGRSPNDPVVQWRPEGRTEWQTVNLTRKVGEAYVLTFTNVQTSFSYRVMGSDAVSPEFKVAAYVPPQVKDWRIDLTYPSYTGLKPSTQTSPNISAVRATTVNFSIRPTTELAAARLKFSKSSKIELVRVADGLWSAASVVAKDEDYWIELQDQKAHSGGNDQPYHIRALPDNPPKVEIAEPGKDIRASVTNKVLVKISVADDFGVGNVKLVYNKMGGTQQELPAKIESRKGGEVMATAELDLAQLEMKEYELVAYHAEATDNNTLDGPGIGRSPVYFIETSNQEGGKCLSQAQGQKVNLLVIQKQIIADTTGLHPEAPKEKFDEMAARQKDAADFGQLYLDSMSGGGAPEAVLTEMQQAVRDMHGATTSLERQKRAEAIPTEESALAHLYQVLKQMPELDRFPTTPPPPDQQPPPNPKVQVVLQAILQQKKEPADNKEIQQALDQAKDLARAQSDLNLAMRPQESPPGAESPKKGSPGKPNANSEGSNSTPGNGKGQAGSEAEQQSDPTSAKGQGKGQNVGEMAQKENHLSKEVADLAQKLKRLAGKDTRLGHNAGRNAAQAAANMSAASQALAEGATGQAGEQGFQGELALRSVIAQLEKSLKNQPEASDVASEDAPRRYEALISEYLKKLSHAE